MTALVRMPEQKVIAERRLNDEYRKCHQGCAWYEASCIYDVVKYCAIYGADWVKEQADEAVEKEVHEVSDAALRTATQLANTVEGTFSTVSWMGQSFSRGNCIKMDFTAAFSVTAGVSVDPAVKASVSGTYNGKSFSSSFEVQLKGCGARTAANQ